MTVGTRFPAHATILGRVLLSDVDDVTLNELYPEPTLPKVAPHTPRRLAELRRLLRQDRTRGYGVSELFFEHGISAVAAPVKGADGRIVAAISVTAQRPNSGARGVARTAGDISPSCRWRAFASAQLP